MLSINEKHLEDLLAGFISFVVSTPEYVIAGILDKVATSATIPVTAAGQLITVFAIANAFGSPIVLMATAKMDRRKLLMLSLSIIVLGSVLTITLPGLEKTKLDLFLKKKSGFVFLYVVLLKISLIVVNLRYSGTTHDFIQLMKEPPRQLLLTCTQR